MSVNAPIPMATIVTYRFLRSAAAASTAAEELLGGDDSTRMTMRGTCMWYMQGSVSYLLQLQEAVQRQQCEEMFLIEAFVRTRTTERTPAAGDMTAVLTMFNASAMRP